MRSKITNAAIFTIISVITIIPYYIFRSENIEKKYINGIIGKSEMIRPAAEMLNREESPDPEKVKKIFNEIMINEPSAAALALTDKSDSLKYLIKNDRIIVSGTVVDLLLNDIKEKSFTSDNKKEPFVRNYNDGRGGSEKFYIYPYSSNSQRTFAVFAFKLEKKILIRLAFELVLLICFSFMVTGMVLTLLRKKGITDDVKIKTIVLGAKKTSPDKPDIDKETKPASKKKTFSAAQIDENELSPIIGAVLTGTEMK